jgi:hypothetical protein
MEDETKSLVLSAALPRLHSYPPEKFPLTLRIYSGKTRRGGPICPHCERPLLDYKPRRRGI